MYMYILRVTGCRYSAVLDEASSARAEVEEGPWVMRERDAAVIYVSSNIRVASAIRMFHPPMNI